MAVDATLAWSNTLSIILTAIVSVVATLWLTNRGSTPSTGPPEIPGFVHFLRDTFVYMPHVLLAFGVLADMFTYQGVYSIPSLVGLVALAAHGVFKFPWGWASKGIASLWSVSGVEGAPTLSAPGSESIPKFVNTRPAAKGGAPPGTYFSKYNGCDIQGFGWAHSPYAPQTLVVIAAIFCYYLFDLITNRGWVNSTATIVLGAVIYVTQLILAGDCSLPGEEVLSKWTQAFTAFVEGLVWGGLSYGIIQTYAPQQLPSAAISPFPKTTPNMLRDGKFDKDGNPWVCVGGNCYPDMSSADARKKFAGIAAESTGNGRSAVGEDCPAD